MKPFIRRLLLLGAFSCSLLLGTGTARAVAGGPATYTVDTTTDNPALSACTAAATDCSLRGALAKADSDAATDIIVLGSGTTYTLTQSNGALFLATSATIQGNNATIAAGGSNRALTILGSATAPSVSISDLTFSGGSAAGAIGTGGAIDAKGVLLTLTHCTFTGNTASATGGAVALASLFAPALAGTLNATDCTFASNSGLNGSALSVVASTATLNRCTFSGNTASGSHGGAIYVTGTAGTFGASNATIANNSASGAPSSGVVGGFGGSVQLTNCTLSGNSGTAGNFAVGRASTAPTFSALNTIFSVPSGATLAANLTTGFTSNGHNLFTDSPTQATGSDLVNKSSSTLFDGTLKNKGGVVQILALSGSSPALNAGDDSVYPTLPTDARGAGFARLRGSHVDIGAYEDSPPVPAVPSASLATWRGRSLINRPDEASDADGDTLTWSAGTAPSHGTLTVDSSDGLFLYVPSGTYTGPDSFTLSVTDGTTSASVSYSVTVAAAPTSGTRIYTAVGASDANGYGASDYVPTLTAPHGYSALLEGKFKSSEGPGGKWALSNRGVNGFTAPDLVRTVGGQSVLSLAVADAAAAYTLWIGPNDVLHIGGFSTPSETPTAFGNAFSQVVSGLKGTGGAVVVCNVPKVGDLPASIARFSPAQRTAADGIAQNLNAAISNVCTPAGVPVLNLYSNPASVSSANISADGFHPNDAGYQLLADALWPLLTARVQFAPYVVDVTPSSATTARGASQTFALHIKDTNGTANISEVWLMANNILSWDGGATLLYIPSPGDVTQGVLYTRLNGAWGQSIIGSGGTILQGDGASINAANVSVAADADGQGFTIQLPLTAGLLIGTNTVWGRVQDAQGQTDLSGLAGQFGFVAKGTWTVTTTSNTAPVVASVLPAAGTTWTLDGSGLSEARTITLSGSDADGANDLVDTWLIVGPSRTWTHSATLYYRIRSHTLWLRNDDGDAWLAPVSVGAAGAVLENSAIRVDASTAVESRTSTGTTMSVSVQLKSALLGQPHVWVRFADQSEAVDARGDNLGFVDQGTWNIERTGGQNSAPTVQTYAPNESSAGGTAWTVGVEREAVMDVQDADGAQDLESASLLAGTILDWDQGATLVYTPFPSSPTQGTLYLRGNGTFLRADITGTQTGTLSNGHVSVRLNGVSIETTNDGHLKVHLPLTFAADMAKTLKVWGRAQDKVGAIDPASQQGFVLQSPWQVTAPASPGGRRTTPSAPNS